jgi:hypothetical protein
MLTFKISFFAGSLSPYHSSPKFTKDSPTEKPLKGALFQAKIILLLSSLTSYIEIAISTEPAAIISSGGTSQEASQYSEDSDKTLKFEDPSAPLPKFFHFIFL